MSDSKMILRGTRVLVLDDNHGIRDLLLECLIDCGCNAVGVASVPEALLMLNDFKPHVIISDIQMPGEDGFAFIKKLRNRNATQGGNIPVIAASGSGIPEREILAAGFQAFLPKPLEVPKLIKTIADLVKLCQ